MSNQSREAMDGTERHRIHKAKNDGWVYWGFVFVNQWKTNKMMDDFSAVGGVKPYDSLFFYIS